MSNNFSALNIFFSPVASSKPRDFSEHQSMVTY
jgi:hypothetical protein